MDEYVMMDEYVVYEGMGNPREPTKMGWREWSRHPLLKDAKKEAKQHAISRIDKSRTIALYRDGKQVTTHDFVEALQTELTNAR